MQMQTRKIHIICFSSGLEPTQNQSELLHMFGLDTRGLPALEESLQSFVLEALNHAANRNPLRYGLQGADLSRITLAAAVAEPRSGGPQQGRQAFMIRTAPARSEARSQLYPLPRRPVCDREVLKIIYASDDFPVVFGRIKKEGIYNFPLSARSIKRVLTKRKKNVSKFDLGTIYAPHPRNPKIRFSNLNIGLTTHYFGDIR
jgi:hypothetical protein